MITSLIGSITFSLVIILYILLALGYPLGDFAMGGKYKVLPKTLRISCAISIIVQVFSVLVLLQLGNIFSIGIPDNIAKGFAYFIGFYLCINTIMNLFSKSSKERFIMTPLSAITAFCFFYTVISI